MDLYYIFKFNNLLKNCKFVWKMLILEFSLVPNSNNLIISKVKLFYIISVTFVV